MEYNSLGDKEIQSIKDNIIYIIRYRLNEFIEMSGASSAKLVASIIWKILSFVTFFFIYLVINILLGIYLARFCGGSLLGGFGLVLLAYATIALLLLLFRGAIENAIRQAIAGEVIRIKDKLNSRLDAMPQMKVQTPAKHNFDEEQVPLQAYETLLRSSKRNRQRAEAVQQDLQEHIGFVKANYKQLAFSMATSRVEQNLPLGKHLATLMHFIEPSPANSKAKKPSMWAKILPDKMKNERLSETRKSAVRNLKPYLPYIALAWRIAKPALSALAVSKGQKFLLKGLLRKKK